MRSALLALACLVAGLSHASDEPAQVRGITLSSHRGGQDWGSDALPAELVEMRALGANWIAIHPYARIEGDGSVRARHTGSKPPEHIVGPIRDAHAAGLKILIKPHLAYWGSPFGWRGEITFERKDELDRFWNEYEAFILELAEWTQKADGFVVGTELRLLQADAPRWRALIAKVRAVTDVPLTYAANWDDYANVAFWDSLDWVGIQAYFPLTDEEDPGRAAIENGWDRWMGRLASYAAERRRPILFTELGYNQSYRAAIEPWDYATDDAGSRSLQELCMSVALRSIESEDSVIGVFLWKWFLPPRRVGRNFQLASPGMRNVIRQSWSKERSAPR